MNRTEAARLAGLAVQEVCLVAVAAEGVMGVVEEAVVQAQMELSGCGFTNERHNKKKSSRR